MIIGYCRFSWFGISDTGRDISDIETARSVLWKPERIAIRFHLFEKVMLPSIRAQTDQDFTLVVLVSNEMPDIYHHTLERIVAGMPNVEVLATSETVIDAALMPKVQGAISQVERSLHFRIDDDDALCGTYIERMRRLKEKYDFEEGTSISFTQGVTGFLHDGVAKQAPRWQDYNSVGLAFVLGEKYQKNPFQVAHLKVGRRYPSYVDPTFLAFHYTLHPVNNTNGYEESFSKRTLSSQQAGRFLRNNLELHDVVVNPKFEKLIDKAGFGSSAQELRKYLGETRDYTRLAEIYGFV